MQYSRTCMAMIIDTVAIYRHGSITVILNAVLQTSFELSGIRRVRFGIEQCQNPIFVKGWLIFQAH